ncbi:MAG: putative ABC transporter permease [Agathobacter sp.]|nr:putative ABC transporter permease [Agathobacter sp.]
MKKRTYALCMIIAIVSFLGFLVENIWCAFTKGYVDNRSMFFPFLIGYGIAIILIYLILGTPEELRFLKHRVHIESKMVRIVLYLIGVMLCVSIGEILLGKLVEHVCGFQWWNYSKLPLHITQYTSIPTSFAFGVLITTFMNFFFEPLIVFFEGWNDTVLKVTATILMVIMVGDFLYAAYKMIKTQGPLIRWRLFLKK